MAITPPNENQSNNPIPRVVGSTNRSQPQSTLGSRSTDTNQDPFVAALEGGGGGVKGSYTTPKVIRFPLDISSGEYPHVMQFKIYWRWERKDLAGNLEKAKKDTQESLDRLQNINSKLSNGKGSLLQNTIAASSLYSSDPKTAEEMFRNPSRAKQILERKIDSEQTSLSDLNSIGKIGKTEDERLLIQDRINSVLSNSSAAGAGGVFGTSSAVIGGIGGFLLGGGKGALIGSVGGGLIGAGVGSGAVASAQALQAEPVYDQMVSVYLPFCTKINNEDSFVFEETGGMRGVKGVLESTQGAGSLLDAVTQGLEAAAIQSLPGGLGTATSSGRGIVVNPRLEKLFKQKDMRTFTFSWELYPKNEQETEALKDLIKTIRYHAHPAKDEAVKGKESSLVAVNLRVPAEFVIKFLSYNTNGGAGSFQENPYIPKIARCVVNSISVDYTPNAVFSSFKNDSPTAVTLTMTMTEITANTREIVDQGY